MQDIEQTSLPESFREYFWDIEFEDINIGKNAFFIIKRVLDRGKSNDLRWIIKRYGMEKIKQVVLETRDLSQPTGNFWADIFNLDKSRVPCLQKPYSPIHFGLYS